MSIAQRITATYILRMFLYQVYQAQRRKNNELYEYLDAEETWDPTDANEEDDEEDAVEESTAYATTFTITTTPTPQANGRGYTYATKCKWVTRSHGLCTLPGELIKFIVAEFKMEDGPRVRTVQGFTQYSRNKITFRAHPNYRSEGKAWYDWAYMAYEMDNGLVSHLPVRFAAFIKDLDEDPHTIHPIVQWSTKRTSRNSVLFSEYHFPHDLEGNTMASFQRHPAACIQRPCWAFAPLANKKIHPKNFVMVSVDREHWAKEFVVMNY